MYEKKVFDTQCCWNFVGWAQINFIELQNKNSTFPTGPLNSEELALIVAIANIGGFIGNFAVVPISRWIGVKRAIHLFGVPLIVRKIKRPKTHRNNNLSVFFQFLRVFAIHFFFCYYIIIMSFILAKFCAYYLCKKCTLSLFIKVYITLSIVWKINLKFYLFYSGYWVDLLVEVMITIFS